MSTYNLAEQFSTPLLNWFEKHGRKNLPWQNPKDPYKIWISEIMLQQTQVQTVIPYFNRFMESFPTLLSLAQAEEDAVLALWSGLGYYSRARNLHRCAKMIVDVHFGVFPQNLDDLIALPGIGPSTAAAILSQAFDLPTAILDGNVKRVLARFFLIDGWPEQAQVKKKLWTLANQVMPQQNCGDYTQAIMDLGATCCTNKNPQCHHCPVQNHCQAFKNKTQSLYPTKRSKKPVPIHEQQFLVLLNDESQIYLEKRPPSGIWGGLWCLPSIEIEANPLHFIESVYGLQGDLPQKMTAFKHQFTHMQLQITAMRIQTKPITQTLQPMKGLWYAKEQLQALGLAKPTQQILDLVD